MVGSRQATYVHTEQHENENATKNRCTSKEICGSKAGDVCLLRGSSAALKRRRDREIRKAVERYFGTAKPPNQVSIEHSYVIPPHASNRRQQRPASYRVRGATSAVARSHQGLHCPTSGWHEAWCRGDREEKAQRRGRHRSQHDVCWAHTPVYPLPKKCQTNTARFRGYFSTSLWITADTRRLVTRGSERLKRHDALQFWLISARTRGPVAEVLAGTTISPPFGPAGSTLPCLAFETLNRRSVKTSAGRDHPIGYRRHRGVSFFHHEVRAHGFVPRCSSLRRSGFHVCNWLARHLRASLRSYGCTDERWISTSRARSGSFRFLLLQRCV